MSPKRIQLKRTKGWRLPDGAIVVARPTRWGNPWSVDDQSHEVSVYGVMQGSGAGRYNVDDERHFQHHLRCGLSVEEVVRLYREDLEWVLDETDHHYDELRVALEDLRGHDLACWCALDQPCHADVLLELANR